jgi:hypothetical protein
LQFRLSNFWIFLLIRKINLPGLTPEFFQNVQNSFDNLLLFKNNKRLVSAIPELTPTHANRIRQKVYELHGFNYIHFVGLINWQLDGIIRCSQKTLHTYIDLWNPLDFHIQFWSVRPIFYNFAKTAEHKKCVEDPQ